MGIYVNYGIIFGFLSAKVFQINLKSFRINHSKTIRIIVDLFEKIHIIPFSLLLLQHTEAHLPTRHHLPGNLPLKL